MKIEETAHLFLSNGGRFLKPAAAIAEKQKHIRAYLFDWDGVFNTGVKGQDTGSLFSEVDSMGTNLLRYTHWLQHGTLPFIGIITGENNHTAYAYARREHFDTVYFNFKNKRDALHHLSAGHQIQPSEICFVFDDVLDLAIARHAGLRFFVRNPGSVAFADYVARDGYCDYATAVPGGQNAVREISDLLICLSGRYDEVMENRIAFSDSYAAYLSRRNTQPTTFFTWKDEQVQATEI